MICKFWKAINQLLYNKFIFSVWEIENVQINYIVMQLYISRIKY